MGDLVVTRDVAPPDDVRVVRSRAHARWASIRRAVVATDLVACLATIAIADAVGGFTRPSVVPLVAASWLAIFAGFGLYPTRLLSGIDEARRLIGATCGGALVALLVAEAPSPWVPLVALSLELVGRRAWRLAIHRLRRSGALAFRTLIVGTGSDAAVAAHALRVRGSGHVPLGFIATGGPLISPDGLTVLGTLEHLDDAIRGFGVDCVFVCSAEADAGQLETILHVTHRAGVELRLSTYLPAMRTSRASFEATGDLLSLGIEPVRFSIAKAIAKRGLDVAVASLLMLLSAPVWIVVSAAIRLTSPGPILFRQRRVTQGGRVFTMLKFRTMVPDAEQRMDGLDPTMPFFKVRDDARVTRIGRVLRTLSLDELPQLVNVLRGEMSMVGPRPLPVEQIQANADRLAPRHEARAGLTGWWQVNGRSDVEPDEALAMDLFYIRNWSVGLDLYILWRTARAMLDRRGAV